LIINQIHKTEFNNFIFFKWRHEKSLLYYNHCDCDWVQIFL
jgi:hypothetical protein